jgi:hypothetical protein
MELDLLKAIFRSNARIELMLKAIISAKYGEKEAIRVYGEIIKTVDKNLKMD